LEKSKETGAELQNLTSAMSDIQETLSGGLVSAQTTCILSRHMANEVFEIFNSHPMRMDML